MAKKLDTTSVSATRLNESIELMKSVEKDLADGRYEDAARKRRDAMDKLRSAFSDVDHGTAEADPPGAEPAAGAARRAAAVVGGGVPAGV